MSEDLMLVVDRRGTLLEHREGRLFIHHPEHTPRSVPIRALGSVILQGDITLTTALLRQLAKQGISVTLLPGRDWRNQGDAARLEPMPRSDIEARLAQYACHARPECRLHQARTILADKLQQQRRHLEGRGLSIPPVLNPTLEDCTELGCLMGKEGAAAAAYFQSLAEHLDPLWGFNGRNRRPPKDPLNALLSLSYTLALSEVRQAIVAIGLEPQLGFLHSHYPLRDGLALDLLEPLRPQLDNWAIDLLQQLSPDDFHGDSETGCRLRKAGRSDFYREWAQLRAQWPQWMSETSQPHSLPETCRQMASALRNTLKQTNPEDTASG